MAARGDYRGMTDVHFTDLLIVVAIGLLAPLMLGFFPRLRLPAIVLEMRFDPFHATSTIPMVASCRATMNPTQAGQRPNAQKRLGTTPAAVPPR